MYKLDENWRSILLLLMSRAYRYQPLLVYIAVLVYGHNKWKFDLRVQQLLTMDPPDAKLGEFT